MFLVSLCLFCTGCRLPAQMSGASGAVPAYEVTDIQGTVTQMPDKPQRILTLSMGTDEIMLGLVPPERMAAVNSLLDDPVESNITVLAQQIPMKTGNPGVEEIAALQPDLVIVPDWGNLEPVEALRDLGLKVVVCKGVRNREDIRETITLLAAAAGEPQRGEKLLQKMDAKLADIQAQVAEIPSGQRKSVVLVSLMSSYGGIGCTFDDACHYAGVTNGMSLAGIHSGQTMSKEQLVKINPDVLFLPTYTNHGSYDVQSFCQQYLDDPALQSMKAVQQQSLREPREGYIYNGSQDFVFGVQEIAYMVYGDAFYQPADEHLTAVDE